MHAFLDAEEGLLRTEDETPTATADDDFDDARGEAVYTYPLSSSPPPPSPLPSPPPPSPSSLTSPPSPSRVLTIFGGGLSAGRLARRVAGTHQLTRVAPASAPVANAVAPVVDPVAGPPHAGRDREHAVAEPCCLPGERCRKSGRSSTPPRRRASTQQNGPVLTRHDTFDAGRERAARIDG